MQTCKTYWEYNGAIGQTQPNPISQNSGGESAIFVNIHDQFY